MTTDAFEFEGRRFQIPAPIAAFDVSGERMALAFLTGGAVKFGRDFISDAISPGAVDLSLVRSGRCPLLIEHCRSLDALIGQVVAAELDGPLLRAMVRFAPVPEADRLWTLLQAGFPISLSVGATVQQADVVEEHDDCRVIRCGRWTLSEVSVCVYGRDPAAHLRKLNWDDHAGEIVERMQERAGGAKRAAVEGALHLDRWRKWALGAGLGMAEDLGVDRDALCDALDERVASHCERLIADLAA